MCDDNTSNSGASTQTKAFFGVKLAPSVIKWKDILRLVDVLNNYYKNEYVFAPLHRAEGGLIILKAPGFMSTEGVDGPRVRNPNPSLMNIRFKGPLIFHWPSNNRRFYASAEDEIRYIHNHGLYRYKRWRYIQLEFVAQNAPILQPTVVATISAHIANTLGWKLMRSKGYKNVEKAMAELNQVV